jgi:hypothetical protein
MEWGNAGNYSRLVTSRELPVWLKVLAQDLIREEMLTDMRKSRSKNQQLLLDNITKSEYTRLLEEGKNASKHLTEIADP